MLNVQGEDAELLATELAALAWDPMKLKEEIWHECQRVSGHRIIELQSRSNSTQVVDAPTHFDAVIGIAPVR